MVAICPNFKWLGFQISDPIQNLDHLQPNLFLTVRNPDLSGFQIPTVVDTFSNPEVPNPYVITFQLNLRSVER